MFLRNVSSLSTDYTALHPRRQSSSHIKNIWKQNKNNLIVGMSSPQSY
jgi:hypothetical protein